MASVVDSTESMPRLNAQQTPHPSNRASIDPDSAIWLPIRRDAAEEPRAASHWPSDSPLMNKPHFSSLMPEAEVQSRFFGV